MANKDNTSKKGTEYELFVKRVYEDLFSVEGVINPEIQHNVIIKGRSGATHQIDLLWKFTFAGVDHVVFVECKDYKTPINIGRIQKFHSTLADIPGVMPQGVFATTTGYQKGAKTYADSYGIKLMLIREVEEGASRKIREIHLHLIAQFIDNVKFKPTLDGKWLEDNNISPPKPDYHLDAEVFVEDKEDGSLKSLWELKNAVPRDVKGYGLVWSKDYREGYLIFDKDSSNTKKYKLSRLDITYDCEEITEDSVIRGNPFAVALIRDVSSGEQKLLNSDNSVTILDLNKEN
jgi:hypothetical protein